MNRLKAALIREYEDDPNTTMEVHNPRNTIAVELYFRGEKIAKVSELRWSFLTFSKKKFNVVEH